MQDRVEKKDPVNLTEAIDDGMEAEWTTNYRQALREQNENGVENEKRLAMLLTNLLIGPWERPQFQIRHPLRRE